MPQLSPQDDLLTRSQPQEYRLYLSLYQPETVFTARCLNIPTGTANRVIPYLPSSVTTGTPAGVIANMVMMVGTTAGANDLGTVRVRNFVNSGSVNQIVVAANSHIHWVSGSYLTILNYIDVEAIYPHIDQTASQSGTISATFYKDWDIPYTNQNTVQGSFVCMGPHRAAFRDPATGQTQLYWSSSGSVNVVSTGTALAFQWEFEGGTPTGSTLRDPGYVTYSTPGHYRTRLIVYASGTQGVTTDFGVRFVSIYDQPDAGPNRPIVKWEIQDLNGQRKSGGYQGRVKVWERVGPEFIKDGQLVVMFSDDYYGGVRKNIGGNAENCSSIFWVGYVLKNTIIYDYKEGTVEFQIGSISEMMKQAEGFSISCQDDVAPNTWYKIKNLSVLRSLWHYLRWHSTVFNLNDFQYTGDDRLKDYLDTNRESMYDALSKFLKSNVWGELVSDRQGKLWAEITPQGWSTTTPAYPFLTSLGTNDIGSSPKTNSVAISSKAARVSNGPQITERLFPETSYVEYGGIVWYGAASGTGFLQAVLAGGPGITPAYKGQIDHMEGMALSSQSQLNQIVGNSYAYQNSRFPEIAFPLTAAFKNIDIAPISVVYLSIDPNLNPRLV